MLLGNLLLLGLILLFVGYLNWHLIMAIKSDVRAGSFRAFVAFMIDAGFTIYVLMNLFSYLNTIKVW